VGYSFPSIPPLDFWSNNHMTETLMGLKQWRRQVYSPVFLWIPKTESKPSFMYMVLRPIQLRPLLRYYPASQAFSLLARTSRRRTRRLAAATSGQYTMRLQREGSSILGGQPTVVAKRRPTATTRYFSNEQAHSRVADYQICAILTHFLNSHLI
jgi:hypothetical protein